jgi:hypothetical protein
MDVCPVENPIERRAFAISPQRIDNRYGHSPFGSGLEYIRSVSGLGAAQSARNARTGSIRVARLAGTRLATIAIAINTDVTAAYVSTSVGLTP